MAFRPILRQHAIPAAVGVAAGIALVAPRRQAFAETSDETSSVTKVKKPIYDSPNTLYQPIEPVSKEDPATAPPEAAEKRPTPTDQLTGYVRVARIQLYNVSSAAEDSFNKFLSRALSVENNFTSTIASLAPPASSNEQLLPGLVYVLVSTMAGTILARNRNLLLRFAVPIGLGIGTAYAVIPLTMQNVGGLVWKYEERYPAIRDAHIATRERIERILQTSKAHSGMALQQAEEKLGDARKSVEDWVKKGK